MNKTSDRHRAWAHDLNNTRASISILLKALESNNLQPETLHLMMNICKLSIEKISRIEDQMLSTENSNDSLIKK